MMKKLFALAALALALFACKKENTDEPSGPAGGNPLTGIWELSSVQAKASVGDVSVSVYVEFTADNQFTLYQKIGEGRYSKFTGTYDYSSDNKLSGKYSGGDAWGPYTAAVSGDTLTLEPEGGKEVDTYKKVDSVPQSVTGNLY